MTIRAGQFLGDSTSQFIRPSKFRRLQQLYRKVGKALLSHFTAKAHDLALICLSVEAIQESSSWGEGIESVAPNGSLGNLKL